MNGKFAATANEREEAKKNIEVNRKTIFNSNSHMFDIVRETNSTAQHTKTREIRI